MTLMCGVDGALSRPVGIPGPDGSEMKTVRQRPAGYRATPVALLGHVADPARHFFFGEGGLEAMRESSRRKLAENKVEC